MTGLEDPGPRFRKNISWLQSKIAAANVSTDTETAAGESGGAPAPKEKYVQMRKKAELWIDEFDHIITRLERLEEAVPVRPFHYVL